MKNKPLAVVIGPGGYNDLGLVRSCGEGSMDVNLICSKSVVIPIYRSRYISRYIMGDTDDPAWLFATISKVITENKDRIVLLYPASDLSACVIDEHYKELSASAIIPHAYGQLRTLMDKSVMSEIATKCHLNVPYSHKVDLNLTNDLSFPLPCIIKPLRSIAGDKQDITICFNKKTLNDAANLFRSKGFNSVLIQELISGEHQEEVAVTGVSDNSGNIITYGIIHKIRIRGNGSTVYAKYCQNIDSTLQRKICDFIRETQYSGIFDIEFLHNDNGYYFIESNFRNGAYGYAITRAGFNMPEAFYNLSCQAKLPQYKIKDHYFMEERSDYLNVIEKSTHCFQWIKDFLSTDTFLWWDWRDPAPLLRIPHFIRRHLHME